MSVFRYSGMLCGAVLGLVLGAALAFPAGAGATYYYGNYWSFDQDGQTLKMTKDVSECPTSAVTVSYVIVKYDWAYDGTWIENWTSACAGTNFGKQISLSVPSTMHEVMLPLDPRYQVYHLNAYMSLGPDIYFTQGVVVNQRAQVVIANDEPTPVRIQEIGLASQASTLAPDVLPTSLDTAISIDGTMPVTLTGDSLDAQNGVIAALGIVVFCGMCIVGHKVVAG